jgi:hypothetical protein
MPALALEPRLVARWPRLAWLARCQPGAPVDVLHGAGVEVADGWVCEATWAGDYGEGAFDRTDIVAGTGVRLREGHVAFVSSGSTVDRLHAAEVAETRWVSNSLPCLIAALDASVDPSYGRYYWDFRSIVDGIRRYKRELATSRAPVELVYFDNLRWDGRRLERVEKAMTRGAFGTFGAYRAFLASCLAAVAANLADPRRARPLEMLSTASSGYDSPTVTVLAREAGCREVLSFDRARGRDEESDSGEAIATALGMRVRTVSRDGWREAPLSEVPFIAANAYGEEVHYKGAEALLAGRVLFTGYHGDKVWAKATADRRGEIVRGDPSGLALTEYRLHAGFLHCPVAFWGARRVQEIVALANRPEMAAWDVPGDYSRPICRRIVEEAGVPREAFGIAKRATSVILHNQARFLTEASERRYLAWLRARRSRWLRRGRVPPVLSPTLDRAVATSSLVVGSPRLRGLRALPGYAALERRLAPARLGPTYLRRYVFPWALQEAVGAYPAPPSGQR